MVGEGELLRRWHCRQGTQNLDSFTDVDVSGGTRKGSARPHGSNSLQLPHPPGCTFGAEPDGPHQVYSLLCTKPLHTHTGHLTTGSQGQSAGIMNPYLTGMENGDQRS